MALSRYNAVSNHFCFENFHLGMRGDFKFFKTPRHIDDFCVFCDCSLHYFTLSYTRIKPRIKTHETDHVSIFMLF